MRKASFSVEKVSSNTDAHNTREHSPKYLLRCKKDNPNIYIKYYDYDEFQTLAENRYVEVNNQKMQQKQKDSMFEEALISLEKNHTEKDIENLFKDLNKKFTGHTLINLAIHRDEGHFEKDGIEYYPLGEDFFPPFLEALRHAKKYIFLQYKFIYLYDKIIYKK